jgi:hypothetical protein
MSKQDWPMASFRLKPVMISAARLKEVIRLWGSMVNTPSLMLSRMVQAGDGKEQVTSQNKGSSSRKPSKPSSSFGILLFTEIPISLLLIRKLPINNYSSLPPSSSPVKGEKKKGVFPDVLSLTLFPKKTS